MSAKPASTTVIDQARIVAFVHAVEKHRGFFPLPNMVFRHLVSEMGELDAAMWAVERSSYAAPVEGIGRELLDIIFLACWMAEIHKLDLDRMAPARMREIVGKYGVKIS